MNHIADKIIKHRKAVLIFFIISVIISAVLSQLVDTNFDLVKYLPEDTKSTVSLELMNDEFQKSPPNARVLVENVSVVEALEYKDKVSKVDGVREISWLDDAVDINTPIEMMESKTLESFYKDKNALFTLTIDTKKDAAAVEQIGEIVKGKGEVTGAIVDDVQAQESAGGETSQMTLFIVPLILLILLLTTSSWIEPFLFLITIGVAIVLNNGTNAFLGEVSFITKSTAAILQLAVSMDYSIFILHRFQEYRHEGMEVKEAITLAMKKSFSSILASGLTTIIGFGALILMRFKIGPDLGVVLAKGIFFSLLSVMLLLPVLTVFTYKIIDKTHHRSFLPSFKGFAKFAIKLGVPVMIIVGILMVPSFLAQNKNDFMYGASAVSINSGKTDKIFGKANNMVILVPNDNIVKEQLLSDELSKLPYVSATVSYVDSIGATIPSEFIPSENISDLQSKKYSRFILTIATSSEGDSAFKAVEEIRAIGHKHYGEEFYFTGGSANIYDMKQTVVEDNKLVTIAAIIGIGIVLLLTFRSISFPLILLLTIESSIWINLSFPYFAGQKLAYLGFMIISSIQLGATVDYAILFASRYKENRSEMHKKDAALKTISDTSASIMTSAGILAIAGFIMNIVSTNEIIGQLGLLIARGTLLSAALVLLLLPTLLVMLDKVIQKTTLKLNYLK